MSSNNDQIGANTCVKTDNKKLELSKLSADELILLKAQTNQIKHEHYSIYNQLDESIRIIDSILYNKCEHNWETSYCTMYEGPDRICTKCNLHQ
jgi:hypothetical protein